MKALEVYAQARDLYRDRRRVPGRLKVAWRVVRGYPVLFKYGISISPSAVEFKDGMTAAVEITNVAVVHEPER